MSLPKLVAAIKWRREVRNLVCHGSTRLLLAEQAASVESNYVASQMFSGQVTSLLENTQTTNQGALPRDLMHESSAYRISSGELFLFVGVLPAVAVKL